VGVDVDHPAGFFSSLWVETQGDYYIDPQYIKDQDGGYTVWNAKIGYKLKLATIGLEVKNLFDTRYDGFIWNDPHGYSPGDGRSVYVWVTFDG
jgi:iron complex outermembrane receptor protein